MPQALIGLLLYLSLMLAIGGWVSLRIRSESDYLVAGRSMGMALVTFSIFATWFGAEAVVSTAGVVYSDGLRGAAVDPFGYVFALLGAGALFAKVLSLRGYTTYGDLFAHRYGRHVERLAVVMLLPPSIAWAAVQIRAFGQVLTATAGIDLEVAILAAAIFVIAYTLLGGLLADAITDLIQGVALIIGLALIFWTTQAELGGIRASLTAVDPERLKLFGGTGGGWLVEVEYWAVPVLGSMLSLEIVQRILGARSPEVARRGTIAGASLYLLVALIPIYLGLVGPQLVPGLEDPEQLVPSLARRHLGGVPYVIFSGALVSIILSTVDSNLLSIGGLIAHNLVVPLRPTMSERGKLVAVRVGVLGAGLVATVMALWAVRMFDLMYLGAEAGTAGLFVVASFALFSKRGGPWSAGLALVSAMSVWAIGTLTAISAPFLASLVAAIVAYLLAARIWPIGTAAGTDISETKVSETTS